jgi:hypothetical protein
MSEGGVLAFIFFLLLILIVGGVLAWYFWYQSQKDKNKGKCTTNSDCRPGEVCDKDEQRCIPEKRCKLDADCNNADEYCAVGGVCMVIPKCSGDSQCNTDQFCNTSVGICIQRTVNGKTCPKSPTCFSSGSTSCPSGSNREDYVPCIPNWHSRVGSGLDRNLQKKICEEWGGCFSTSGQGPWCYFCQSGNSTTTTSVNGMSGPIVL